MAFPLDIKDSTLTELYRGLVLNANICSLFIIVSTIYSLQVVWKN